MNDPKPLAFSHHDHRVCRQTALALAEQQGLRLTKWRRKVLDLLLEGHRSMGAYEILERLRVDDSTPQPPTAYRALEYLVENGLVHRLEKLNAYVACARPDACERAGFIVCKLCRTVAEIECKASEAGLLQAAAHSGFAAESSVMEVDGICADCQKSD